MPQSPAEAHGLHGLLLSCCYTAAQPCDLPLKGLSQQLPMHIASPLLPLMQACRGRQSQWCCCCCCC